MTTIGDDIGGDDGDRALAAEYVLGLLDASEHAEVAKRMAFESDLAAEARVWKDHFSSLNGQFADVTPPANFFARIERRLFGVAPQATGFAALWENLNLWRGLATAGLALAVVALGVNMMRPAPIDPKALASQFVAALTEEGSNVSFVALYDPNSGSFRLTSLSGDAVPQKDFELWAIQGGDAPVSMGVVPVNQRTEVKMTPEVLAKFGAGSVLAVTLEPKGGSPTGAPTGPIVAKGAATLI